MSELKEYRYAHKVPADVWKLYLEQDQLALFVEDIGWKAIHVARDDGVHKVRDVRFFITDNTEFITVEVTLLYVSSL